MARRNWSAYVQRYVAKYGATPYQRSAARARSEGFSSPRDQTRINKLADAANVDRQDARIAVRRVGPAETAHILQVQAKARAENLAAGKVVNKGLWDDRRSFLPIGMYPYNPWAK